MNLKISFFPKAFNRDLSRTRGSTPLDTSSLLTLAYIGRKMFARIRYAYSVVVLHCLISASCSIRLDTPSDISKRHFLSSSYRIKDSPFSEFYVAIELSHRQRRRHIIPQIQLPF